MPSTRPGRDREEKRTELVDAARRLFVQDGYDATSMAALAREAGVAANTVYWYVGDKDDVLIAVLDAVLAEGLADYASIADRPLGEQLRWTVERLRGMRRLVATLHARIGRSAALDAWHDAFHASTEGILRAALEGAVDPGAIDAEVRIAVFAVEGLLTHELAEQERRAVCDQLAARWAAPEDRPGRPPR